MYDHLELPRMEGDEIDVKAKQIEEKPKKVSLKEAERRRRTVKKEESEEDTMPVLNKRRKLKNEVKDEPESE